jgi:hypothetical protein
MGFDLTPGKDSNELDGRGNLVEKMLLAQKKSGRFD